MVVRMLRHVMGFRRRVMMQEGMFRLNRQGPADGLRQQRTENHAENAGDKAGELRRDERIVGAKQQQ